MAVWHESYFYDQKDRKYAGMKIVIIESDVHNFFTNKLALTS